MNNTHNNVFIAPNTMTGHCNRNASHHILDWWPPSISKVNWEQHTKQHRITSYRSHTHYVEKLYTIAHVLRWCNPYSKHRIHILMRYVLANIQLKLNIYSIEQNLHVAVCLYAVFGAAQASTFDFKPTEAHLRASTYSLYLLLFHSCHPITATHNM